MSARIGEGLQGPKVALAGNVFSALRDVREAERELKARPGYMAALKAQILKRHWQQLREPRAV